MRQISFLDCAELVGETCKPYNGSKKYVSTGAVAVNHISDADTEVFSYDDKPSRANLIAKPGDILFAKMMSTNKTLQIDDATSQYIYSTGFCAVRAKDGIITDRCLYYLLTSKIFQHKKDENCSGATQKAITNAGLKKLIIGLPLLAQQDAVVSILDILSSITKRINRELYLLDELVKAKYVEMFGTLEYPSMPFKKDTLSNLCTKITDGKHGGCTLEEGSNRYFVGAREIHDNKVHYDTAPEISITEFEKDYSRCNLEIGDFLIVNTGATIGKSAIATDLRTEHTLLQKSVALLKIKPELLNPLFLMWCYKTNPKMYMVESASAQPNLLLSKINSTEIYVPPIDLQTKFAAYVTQVEKSKVVVQSALDKAQLLFDSLMQKYFG